MRYVNTVRLLLTIFISFCLLVSAKALGPHEVLVLANEASLRSVAVAKEFCRLRSVPPVNLVRLRLPAAVTNAPYSISPEDFTTMIWRPAIKAMRDRGLDDQILAWVYSVDFPVSVKTSPPVSIQGITFMRNRVPEAEKIRGGTYLSPLFSGPSNPGSTGYCSQTFDSFKEWLGPDMPLPSFMLGFAGVRGNSIVEIVACLERGAACDGTRPTGTVYFVVDGDVRSRCREWQYPAAVKELTALGCHAVITPVLPARCRDVLGLMAGMAEVKPESVGVFLPGAMAEHLTSASAVFDSPNQTKLTAWIRAGVTASCGAVTEPYALWMKFPHARFYVHYASGCTLIESFFQAVRCPLQILAVGDPLANPWAPRDRLLLKGLGETSREGVLQLRAEPASDALRYYRRFCFLLDGKKIADGPSLVLDTRKLAPGVHTVRAVAATVGLVRNQIFTEETLHIGQISR